MNILAWSTVRRMSQYDALTLALSSVGTIELDETLAAAFTPADFLEAARSLSYVCPYCGRNLPVSEYDRDSVGCGGQCSDCYEEAGLENEIADDGPNPTVEAQLSEVKDRRAKLAATTAQQVRERVKHA